MHLHINDFRSLAQEYKVICFDAYGVLKNHKGFIPGVKETFQFLDQRGIAYYVLTNDASRSPQRLANNYQEAGINEITEEKIISSGMLARDYLENKVAKGIIAYLGTDLSAHYIKSEGMETISVRDLDLNHSDQVNALVLLDDEGFDWQLDLNKAINLLRIRNMPVIVANTDRTYPTSHHEVAVAIGGLANMMEQMVSKKFLRFGKPDTQMFHFAYNKMTRTSAFSKKEILMVGDTLLTDILGGNKFGIDTLLVLSGNTLPHQADIRIETTGIIPDFICESVGIL